MPILKYRNIFILILVMAFAGCAEDPNQTYYPELTEPSLIALYDQVPYKGNCFEGVLRQSEKDKVLDQVNMYRAIHKLPAVTYNNEYDIMMQKASLIMVANESISHYPLQSQKCWSEEGSQGSAESNLHLGAASGVVNWSSTIAVDNWISEEHTLTGLGHRRWVLSPFLKTISFGRVDIVTEAKSHWIGASLYIFDSWDQTPANIDFVACPFEDYPIDGFNKDLYLSFSVLADKTTVWGDNKEVVFGFEVDVEVFDETNQAMEVVSVDSDYSGAGLPNHLQWKVLDLENNKKYNVKISNVTVNGEEKSYDYWFKIKP
ncbi:MAG: CAP domain-containing protein [Candidatus Kapabacteria bacterium]|jgi:hypothetical protein|nr:CAP domain-containing protein [Candidatus Kapabacteria bacterium]